jgi:hypothetical protein
MRYRYIGCRQRTSRAHVCDTFFGNYEYTVQSHNHCRTQIFCAKDYQADSLSHKYLVSSDGGTMEVMRKAAAAASNLLIVALVPLSGLFFPVVVIVPSVVVTL